MGFSLQKKLWFNHNNSLQNKLFRWLRTFNVTTASHARQRKVADEWSGDDLIIEVAPFQSDVCDDTGHYEICSAPWGYIDDLPLHIMNRLDDLERYFFFPEKFIYWCKIYIYCESIWISLSTLKIDDLKITLIYGIPAKKVKCKNESLPENFLNGKI